MKSASLKATHVYPAIPDRIDLADWKQRVQQEFGKRTNKVAKDAYDEWAQKHEANLRAEITTAFGKDVRAHGDKATSDVLFDIAYRMTRPPIRSSLEQGWHETAVKRIHELQPQLDGAIDALKHSGSKIVPKDGMARYDLARLLSSLQDASFEVAAALAVLKRSHMREADAFTFCLPFFSQLREYGATEVNAVALCRVLMKAHGYAEHQLVIFDEDSIVSSLLRRRVDAYIEKQVDISVRDEGVRRTIKAALHKKKL